MKSIWKYTLQTTDVQDVVMPESAVIRALQTQHEIPCLWAEVDVDETAKNSRRFRTFGTGHPISADRSERMDYVGTYQLHSGALVFHVYVDKD